MNVDDQDKLDEVGISEGSKVHVQDQSLINKKGKPVDIIENRASITK